MPDCYDKNHNHICGQLKTDSVFCAVFANLGSLKFYNIPIFPVATEIYIMSQCTLKLKQLNTHGILYMEWKWNIVWKVHLQLCCTCFAFTFCTVHPKQAPWGLSLEIVLVVHHLVLFFWCFGSLSWCRMNPWPTTLPLTLFITTLIEIFRATSYIAIIMHQRV